MPLSRREALRLAALGAVVAGCSAGGSTAHGQPGPAAARPTTQTPSAIDSRRDATPSPASTPATPSAELVHGRRTGSALALTFHGAGDPGIARAVLRELEQARVHVTVLAVGTWLETQPAMATAVLAAGHELGNHTQHHLPMRGLGRATAHREVVECARTLRRLTGSAGRWFRASGTQHTTGLIRSVAASAGYPQCLSYDVDSLDWTDPGPDAIVRAVLGQARAGSIVSMHLGHRGTVDALPSLLASLRTKGLRAVTVSELVR